METYVITIPIKDMQDTIAPGTGQDDKKEDPLWDLSSV